jgi:hypothetical protein
MMKQCIATEKIRTRTPAFCLPGREENSSPARCRLPRLTASALVAAPALPEAYELLARLAAP